MFGASSLNPQREKLRATLCGLTAALFWSLAVAGGRLLTEAFGGMLSVALIHLTAAVLSILYLLISPRSRRSVVSNSYKYTLVCGSLFIFYILTFYQALNLATSREQVVIVGIINYLWPALSLGMSIPILGNRTNLPALLAANGLALFGVGLAIVSAGGYSAFGLSEAVRSDFRPYLLALAAAVSWGLYNNLSRRWGESSAGGSVPVFIIVLAILMSPVLVGNFDRITWSFGILGILLFVAVFPTFLAYFFWDLAQRKGHHATVNSIAYAIPVLSTLATCVFLQIRIPFLTILGCLLVITGAVLSRLVIVEKDDLSNLPDGITIRSIVGLNSGPLRSFLSRIAGRNRVPAGNEDPTLPK